MRVVARLGSARRLPADLCRLEQDLADLGPAGLCSRALLCQPIPCMARGKEVAYRIVVSECASGCQDVIPRLPPAKRPALLRKPALPNRRNATRSRFGDHVADEESTDRRLVPQLDSSQCAQVALDRALSSKRQVPVSPRGCGAALLAKHNTPFADRSAAARGP